MGQDVNIGTINGLTVNEILDLMVEKKIGIAGSGSSLIDSGIISGDVELGKLVNMDGIIWRVVHIDEEAGEFILCKEIVEETTAFGSSVTFSGSTIANLCNTFEQSLSVSVRNRLKPKTVHGVVKNVWIPQSNWISTSPPNGAAGTGASSWSGTSVFQYFTDNTSRIALNASGAAQIWWTASAGSSSNVWFVTATGNLNYFNDPSNTGGFRPFVALPL